MPRHMKITLAERGVSCVAELLDKDAPRTCDAVWNALPQGDAVQHAKYARNEVYTMVPRFAETEPGQENPTVRLRMRPPPRASIAGTSSWVRIKGACKLTANW